MTHLSTFGTARLGFQTVVTRWELIWEDSQQCPSGEEVMEKFVCECSGAKLLQCSTDDICLYKIRCSNICQNILYILKLAGTTHNYMVSIMCLLLQEAAYKDIKPG